MGFVGNYATRGLSPQMYGMPAIPKKAAPKIDAAFIIAVNLFRERLCLRCCPDDG